MKRKQLLLLTMLCSVFVLCGTECEQDASKQMTAWQTLGAQMEANIEDTETKLALVKDPIERAALQGKLGKMKEIAHGFNETLGTLTVVDDPAEGDAGLAAAEAALVGAAGVTSGLSLLAVPFVRLFRQRKQIFKAVDAGGGVKDPAAAKLKLVENQAAWAALQKHQANGAS